MQLVSVSCAVLALATASCQAAATPRKAFTPDPDSYSIKLSYLVQGPGCPALDKITATPNSDYTTLTLQYQDLSITAQDGIGCAVLLQFEPKKADAVGLVYTVLESKYTATLGEAVFDSTYTFAYDVLGDLYGYLTNPAPATSFTKTPNGVTSSPVVKLSKEFKSPPAGAGSIALEVDTVVRNFQDEPAQGANAELTTIREYAQEITLAWSKPPSLVV